MMDLDNLMEVAQTLDKKEKKKRRKPEKNCPECNTANHARSSNCKEGDYEFYVRKNVKQELLAANWRELQPGDIIKVISGSGPYFLSKDKPLNPDGSQQRIMMGEKGKFEVVEVLDNGPRQCGIYGHQLYGRASKSHYREWIYMGESYYKEDVSIHKEHHSIKVLKSCQAT